MREDQKQPWQEIKHLHDPTRDIAEVAESATEFRRCRPEWSPERCWDCAREMHSVKPWGAINPPGSNGSMTWG